MTFVLYGLSLVLGVAFLAGCCLLRDNAGLDPDESAGREAA